MHSDVSPEIRTDWIPSKERRRSELALLFEGNMIDRLLEIGNQDNPGGWEEKTINEVNQFLETDDPEFIEAKDIAIKNMIGLGILQYQEDLPQIDRTQTMIENYGDNGDELFAEISVPINKGTPQEKLLRLRWHGNEEVLRRLGKRTRENAYELTMMPDEVIANTNLPERKSLTETLVDQLDWETRSFNSFIQVIDTMLLLKTGDSQRVKDLVDNFRGKVKQWQNNSKYGMDSGSIGVVFSYLEAEGLLKGKIGFQNEELEGDSEYVSEVDKKKFDVKMKFKLGDDSRDKTTTVVMEIGGSFKNLKKLRKKYLEKWSKVQALTNMIEDKEIGPGKFLKTAKDYGLIDDQGKELY